ncbi:MAG: hypothetical protein EOM44_04755 [Bacteroidia bacterium]|nr:hypothetical protein [Bacteroidia bacterium]
MKTNKKCILGIFIFLNLLSYGQNAAIFLHSKEPASLIISKPIDGNIYNEYYPTDTISLQAYEYISFPVSTKKWSVIRCFIPGKAALDIFVEKNSKVMINIENQKIEFSGDNANVNNLINNNFTNCNFEEDKKINEVIDSIFNNKLETSFGEKIIVNPQAALLNTIFAKIFTKLSKTDSVSSDGLNYFFKNLGYRIGYRMLKKFDKNKFDTTFNKGTEIYIDKNIGSYSYGKYFADLYFSFLFNELDKEKKDSLIYLYTNNKETFGSYARYLLAPYDVQLSLFFDAFILQYKFGVNEFNKEKMFNYLMNKYPSSKSVEILRKNIQEDLDDKKELETVFLANDSVSSFKDLSKDTYLINKYLFIDVWASWCMPCRAEFTHNKALDKLLSKYNNIEKIYISIDEDKDSWKSAIKNHNLSGYHILANTKLKEYLNKNIYDSEGITIPRYILLDTQGSIIHKNMKRPSTLEELQKELDYLLNNN